jgi:Family of unknown function (DUF6492)
MELALITPAYSRHLPLLELSAESVDRFCPPNFPHYIVVGSRDYPLFRHFDGARRRVIVAEDVVPRPAFCLPWLVKDRQIWVLDRHRPIRGWIMQQLLKLCAPAIADADIFLLLDTDVFFIRPFALERVVRDDRVLLWREPGKGTPHYQPRWNRTASQLLGLPMSDDYGANFVGNIITWRRDVLLEMRARITFVNGTHWLPSVARHRYLAEYQLYGVFVQELLGARDLRHLYSNEELCIAWRFMEGARDPEDRRQRLTGRLRSSDVAVNIQSNLYLPLAEVRQLIEAAVAYAERWPGTDGARPQ